MSPIVSCGIRLRTLPSGIGALSVLTSDLGCSDCAIVGTDRPNESVSVRTINVMIDIRLILLYIIIAPLYC